MRLIAILCLAAGCAFGQPADRLPTTDAEKLADALRAGRAFVTDNATVLDWPSSPQGE